MNKSINIQRLLKPYPKTENNKNNEKYKKWTNLVFGLAGLPQGGFKDEDLELINGIFRFDYMGSAEFEWGAAPAAFHKIATNYKNYTTYKLNILYKYEDYSKQTTYQDMGMVWVICKPEDIKEITKRIKHYAKDAWPHHRNFRTRESVLLNIAMARTETNSSLRDLTGWLELDNAFMFFVDEEMFERTCNLFQIENKCKKSVK